MHQNSKNNERPRGRPVETDQQDLKKQILDTAEILFAEQGYAAVPIRLIATEAGVNPALVHYYFGNKRALLKTVVERAFEPLGQAIAAMKNSSTVSPEVISQLLLSMASEHPNIPRLLTREVLLPGGEIQQYFIDKMAPHLGGALPALLEREATAGRMRSSSDPAISAMLIMALCVFPFIARTLAEPVLGIRFDKEGIELLNQQISELLSGGMSR